MSAHLTRAPSHARRMALCRLRQFTSATRCAPSPTIQDGAAADAHAAARAAAEEWAGVLPEQICAPRRCSRSI